VGVLNLGYPWWLLTAVIVVFAARLWFTLGGWERPRIVVPLCALAAVFVAMALSVAITEPLKPPSPPQDGGHRSQDDARAHPPRDDALRRTGFPDRHPFSCGYSVGYAAASPSASPSASPGARTPR